MARALRQPGIVTGIALLAVSMAVGCAGPGKPNPEFDRIHGRRAIPAGLEQQLDPVDSHAVARQGDSVLAHVVAETGAGVVERFVRLTLLGRIEDEGLPDADIQFATGVRNSKGDPLPTTSTMSTANGDSYMHVLSTTGLVLVDVMGPGGEHLASRHVGVEVLAFTASGGPPGDVTLRGGLVSILELILATPELDSLLMDVAKRPPIWVLLDGIRLTLNLELNEHEPIDGGVRHSASIAADGHLALQGAVEQGAKSFPYLLTAGIRRLEAHHPSRADRRASIEVVASRRGTGPALVQGAKGPFPAPNEDSRVPGYAPSPPNGPGKFQGVISGRVE